MTKQQQQRDVLGWVSMLACIAVAAHGEWSLAVAVGFSPWVAAALPVAIDAYAIRAMQAGREILPSVVLMIATNSAAHLHHGGLLTVSPWLVVAVSAIAPVVLWRVHALRHSTATEPVPAPVVAPRNIEVSPISMEVSPAPPPAEVPATASALVICGEHLPVPPVPPRPKLGTEDAREAIEKAWRDGLSIREAARASTRSASQVQRVYARLDADHGPALIEGQTEIEIPAAA
ncbi:hypothetical protein [Streptomyces scopuliridis]|uniref:hypothetical protein n=1 Tax=Streptomyces scopuliridis TaxID=452529 RepID=UPI0035DFC28A